MNGPVLKSHAPAGNHPPIFRGRLHAGPGMVEALSKACHAAGQDRGLVQPGAQRTLYAARSRPVAVQLAEQTNRAARHRVPGGGWSEQGARRR